MDSNILNKPSIRLDRQYNIKLMVKDLRLLLKSYKPYTQPGKYHDGSWKGIPLWNAHGSMQDSSASGFGKYQATEALEKCSYLKKILMGLKTPIRVARILFLPAGRKISTHTDSLGFDVGSIRLHIPIITHPDVIFIIDGARQYWKAGEIWYGNFSLPHSVENASSITRVHLVIDCNISLSLLELFPLINKKKFSSSHERMLIFYDHIKYPVSFLSRFEKHFIIPKSVIKEWRGRPKRPIFGLLSVFGEMSVEEGELVTSFPGVPIKFRWMVSKDKLILYGRPNVYLTWTEVGGKISRMFVNVVSNLSILSFPISPVERKKTIVRLVYIVALSLDFFTISSFRKLYNILYRARIRSE